MLLLLMLLIPDEHKIPTMACAAPALFTKVRTVLLATVCAELEEDKVIPCSAAAVVTPVLVEVTLNPFTTLLLILVMLEEPLLTLMPVIPAAVKIEFELMLSMVSPKMVMFPVVVELIPNILKLPLALKLDVESIFPMRLLFTT